MRRVAILQPNYIPWKGVFDLISRVDVFVFYDDVAFTSKDWRTRNRIRTANGDIWLSVPVLTKGRGTQRICDVEIDPRSNWQSKHHKALRSSYQKARHFKRYEYLLEEIYVVRRWTNLAELNIFATRLLASAIGLQVEWRRSIDLGQPGGKNGERAIRLCRLLGCDYFINGPSARAFIDSALFRASGITLDYMEYIYPEYEQLHRPFLHEVTVLDVLFNCGPDSRELICMGSRN